MWSNSFHPGQPGHQDTGWTDPHWPVLDIALWTNYGDQADIHFRRENRGVISENVAKISSMKPFL